MFAGLKSNQLINQSPQMHLLCSRVESFDSSVCARLQIRLGDDAAQSQGQGRQAEVGEAAETATGPKVRDWV